MGVGTGARCLRMEGGVITKTFPAPERSLPFSWLSSKTTSGWTEAQEPSFSTSLSTMETSTSSVLQGTIFTQLGHSRPLENGGKFAAQCVIQ